jgi:hypothetical protein
MHGAEALDQPAARAVVELVALKDATIKYSTGAELVRRATRKAKAASTTS